jgi:hypothetical protein
MQKLLLSLIVLISTLQISLAQNQAKAKKKVDSDNETISIKYQVAFDFSNPLEITYPKKIKTGDFYQVVVEGINLNNYIVQLQNSDTVYSAKALDFPIFGGIDISDLSFSSLNISSLFTIPVEKKKDGNGKVFTSALIQAPDTVLLREIHDIIKLSQNFLTIFKFDLAESNIKIDNQYFDLTKARIRAKALAQIPSTEGIDIDQKLKDFDTLRYQLIDLKKGFDINLKSFDEYFNQPKVIIQIEKEENLKLKKLKEEVVSAYNDKKQNLNSLQSKVNNENVEKAMVSVYQLYQTTTYTSLPIQFNGEEAELRMKFIPKDSASNLQSYTLSPIKFGRSPWYWAVGPSLYYSKLQEERVGLETIQVNDSTQNFKVLPESALKGELGVAALFHFGRKLNLSKGVDMGIHLSVGTGVSLSDTVKPRLLYGGGFSVGERHHLTVDLGWATGYVNRVSTRITDDPIGYDTIYPVKPDVLVTGLDTKFFIGVGYMFRL